MALELRVLVLRGERLRPVEREIEVAAAVVDARRPCARRLVVLEELAVRRDRACRRGPWPSRCPNDARRGARATPRARRIRRASPSAGSSPARNCSHVLRRRAAGARLEQAAALHQRHDGQHLRARADLQDREEVGEVVAEHVARDRDRVLPPSDALERERAWRRPARGSGCRAPSCRAPSGTSRSSR